ncbi:formate dehydrogenase subunit delta [Salinisphaera sp. USBA-960]|uniref:formate dehydrogenase subunit delta n=1 Tax=Salinisphaera orenii TaxID=856731 RepID=UPI000DBE9E70|nr:formate dehydrogenase subunit delta [Salifodinibacter halophilus]NNC25648.1 formate dehydrogenase subunit delta [Salifodinibacter halophilus]
MEQTKMIRHVNQIAAYFEVYPQDRAEESVRGHLEKFMAPSIRRQLADYALDGGDGLHPLAQQAAQNMTVGSNTS